MKINFATILLTIAACVYLVGTLFKITHWQYGDEIRLAAAIIATAGFIVLLAKSLKKSKERKSPGK